MSFSKKIIAFLLLTVATFAVLGYVLFLCTYVILNFSWQVLLLAVAGAPVFLFFFKLLWHDI